MNVLLMRNGLLEVLHSETVNLFFLYFIYFFYVLRVII